MEKGDKIKFTFGKAKKQMEGTVVRVNPKSVFLRVDFPNDKGKLIKRKKHQLS